MIRTVKQSLIALILLAMGSMSAQAVVIDYSLTDLGGGSYEYSYTVENDDLAEGVVEFTTFFDPALYANLTVTSLPAGWDGFVLQPLAGLDGIFDSFAFLAPAVDLGESLGGFSVSFDWLGGGLPGAQPFEIVDFFFNVVDSGQTTLAGGGPMPVPAPAALVLLLTALITLRLRNNLRT